MDSQRDAKPFADYIDQMHAMLCGGYKANDALRDGLWRALKDLPFSEVKANGDRFMASATKDTRFPPPAVFRNRPLHQLSPASTAAHQAAQRNAIRNWRELKQNDAVTFEIEFRTARALTAMAQCMDDTEAHAEWLREYQRWGGLRYAPRAEQEAALKTYLGSK